MTDKTQNDSKQSGAPGSGQEPPVGDRVFAEPLSRVHDFRFDGATAGVFDDMVSRSVPFYGEFQRMTCEIAADFAVPQSNLYDFGCATGTTLVALDKIVTPEVHFVAVDDSTEMLAKARRKFASIPHNRKIDYRCEDLNTGPGVENASVALMVLTLQFIRPLYRQRFVQRVYDGMRENGCFVIVEKILSPHSLLNRQFIEYYYSYKRRQGYSDLEISQKREALENVLIPYRFDENVELLHSVGFRQVEEFFRWYNFCGVVAIK